jgi:Flp pilus assembly protein TadD
MTQSATGHAQKQKRYLPLAAAMTAAVLLAGCASSKTNGVSTHSPSASQAYVKPGSSAAMRAVSSWGGKYQDDSKNRAAILGYANALQQNEQIEQALSVLRSAVISYPQDREIASAYGKILAMNGRLDEALNVVQRAQTPTTPDWKLMSAEAAIYDQMGNHKRARSLYQQALKIVPNEPSLLNNLGLSYLLSNNLPEAEYTLRKAAALPGADSRVRQNLVLALGVQGKFDEAEKVARSELDPRQAEANIAYLKNLIASKRS